jgi:hypothetical protein
MYLFAGFTCGFHLELALTDLAKAGMNDKDIHFIKMNVVPSGTQIIDSISNPDGRSVLDSICGWGTVFGLLGIIYGSLWLIGPILTGLAGLVIGGLVGYLIDKWRNKIRLHNQVDLELILLIRCNSKEQIEQAERICCSNHVTYIGHHLH